MWTARELTVKDGETPHYTPPQTNCLYIVLNILIVFFSIVIVYLQLAWQRRCAGPWRTKACKKGGLVFFPQVSISSNNSYSLQIEHRIPDVLGNKRPDFDGKVTMVVGSGASAATVLQSLKALGTSKVPFCKRR